MYNEVEILPSVFDPLGLFPTEIGIKPFLKWAGGKTQLIPELVKYTPKVFNKYIEPFIGGGAFYFFLNPTNAVIGDLNSELIITYKAIKNSVEDVISHLESFKNNETFYYNIRAVDTEKLSNIERAARLIYLNKTCFNGLYRVNKKGKFNVPYGKRTGSFLDSEGLRNASEFLQNTIIEFADYTETLKKYARKGDFIFLDPPYYPVGKYSDFKRYTKEFFYHDDQIALKEEFERLVNMGCHVILTNSEHPVILELYKNFEIKRIETKRLINSDASKRKGIDIIVIGS
ncbi:MAG: Dam family site-specific DNA-(adenine-N6)-methyltransferase [Weeksellaceae bacterium]|nr:Dam family site-specific DNA-(adenine-N6)-methyltransferase [Weeksellaceae bacterium]